MVENRRFFFRFLHPVFVAMAYVFLYLPVIVLAIFSFNDSEVSSHWVGFTVRWYQELFKNADLLESLQVSFVVAVSATFLSVLLGTCFVLASRWWKTPLLFNIFYTNILLPEIVMSIGLLSIFVFFNIPLGYGSLITGHTLLGLGFVVPIVRARFVELDPYLTEASLDLGATYGQTLRKIYIPLLRPSLLASSLLVFTLSLDDFLIAFFCSNPSVQTLSVYIYSLARAGIDPTINALSACFLIVSSVVVLLLCACGVADQVLGHE